MPEPRIRIPSGRPPASSFSLVTRRLSLATAALLFAGHGLWGAELKPRTLEAWDSYVQLTEQRIERELNDGQRFLLTDFSGEESGSIRQLLQKGQVYIRKMKTPDGNGRQIPVQDGMIHHWMGAIFIPGAHLDAVIEWLHDYDHHAGRFLEIIASKLISRQGDTFQIYFKLRRKKIITVYYNSYYSATYQQKDPHRIFSRSYSTKIAQLDNPETPQEREMPVGNDSGFLWRLNSYWRYEEVDGGVFVECESLSLSRGIPAGLGWLIAGYVESVPRESLENTLTSIRDGSRKAMAEIVPAGSDHR